MKRGATVRKKFAPTYKAGDGDLFQLFDTGELDHVCGKFGVLVELADPAPNSEREAMADALRSLLGRPIEALQARIIESGRGVNAVEWEALERFAFAVEATAMQLPGPLRDDEARELAGNLRTAWVEAVFYASACRMYADLPRELEANKRKTESMREERDARAYAARVDHGHIRDRYAELKAAKARGIGKTLAAEFSITEGAIRNIWSTRDRNKYPS